MLGSSICGASAGGGVGLGLRLSERFWGVMLVLLYYTRKGALELFEQILLTVLVFCAEGG